MTGPFHRAAPAALEPWSKERLQSVECNQLSNVITYNAMFQIVCILAITNVKTIIKLQKPQRDVPKIYVAYYTKI